MDELISMQKPPASDSDEADDDPDQCMKKLKMLKTEHRKLKEKQRDTIREAEFWTDKCLETGRAAKLWKDTRLEISSVVAVLAIKGVDMRFPRSVGKTRLLERVANEVSRKEQKR